MNAGTALEGLIIKSITNTFGHYYGMDKVVIHVEGKPYESGTSCSVREYFNVSDDGTAEYQAPS